MTEGNNSGGYEQPVIKSGYAGLFAIWLIPLLALVIAGWLVFKSVYDKGPEISITLPSAKGMEAGKTPLKYRDVVIGVVDRIVIPDEQDQVDVIVSVNKESRKYLTDTARFWVVAPAIGLEGISGLDTLLSGSYLEIDPGAGGEAAYEFEGLENPPVISSTVPGREYLLRTGSLGNIQRGSPVIYRGLQVGKVLGHRLALNNQSIEIIAFVEDPYTNLVTTKTRFWDAGAVNVRVSTSGVDIGASSFSALLSGAIEFASLRSDGPAGIAESGQEFYLFTGRSAMEEARYTHRVPFVLYFDGSVSGLEVGAPVEFKGIQIGTVRDISLQLEHNSGEYAIPVVINIEPQRIRVKADPTLPNDPATSQNARRRALESLIKRGLRARLKSNNFLTGQLIVDLDLFPEREARYYAEGSDIPEIPTLPTELEEITTSLTKLIEKVEKMPIDRLSISLTETAEGLQEIITEGQITETIKEIRGVAKSVTSIIGKVDKETLPRINEAVDDGRKTLAEIDKTLNNASTLFKTADNTLADGSPLKYDLSIMLRELAAASRSVRNLAEFLERNPSSLLSGKK
ncbi:MCE family protein [Sneathiella sp. P13V-1]|uniref:PqiB family protein n=1 Tax=Sneathiella sp. P13V-1 TaxID=2697366 RepID=UPI00187B6E1F|nr:MlaD family protein [Sneathiella sp. P13V-1]MBE7637235.1 MCE family protein [Sneathiella sp. P13V-1]